ncbi:NosD domain-containing protein [Methanogenium cariaci]|uniref:NosD domain-containing protein n=1 Tax=Methanogenium cariaci TaxID=2197 RepID=UPI001FE0A7C2|nr:NosD domain-containing protein [Methanogenium cariaci]
MTLSGNHCGIYFRNTTSSIITGVTTPENRIGIQLDRSSHNSIVNCRATENGCTGIELRSSEECLLTGNAMDGNRYNFVVYAQEDADYVHSIDTSNTVDGKAIYYLFNATANPEGDFVDAGTIYAFNCTGLDIHDLILSNEYAGVYIRDCSGLDIHDLTLSDNNYGIALGTSTDITLDTIAATENNHGIYLKDCSESTIRGGVTAQNNGDGIMSYDSENNHISDCIIEESKWRSIVLVGNRNCIVSYCTVSNSNAYNNYWYRNIHLIGSNNCILFLNSFVKNTTYEEYYSQDILWNSPSALTYLYGEKMYTHTSPVGNYWGGQHTVAQIKTVTVSGDSPFIGNGFTDNYPLMEPVDAYTFVKNTGGADDIDTTGNNHVGAAGNLNAGDAVTMPFEGAAVTGVTITAAKNINLMTVTVGPVQTGPKGLNGPVYQYLEADLIHTTDDAIAEADFNFSVPKAWLTVQGLTPEDVVLWRYHDGAWVPLPTEVLRDEGDHIVCRAVSPGFSYFAIGEGGDAVTTQPVETTPTADAEAESGDGTIPVSTPPPPLR